MIHHRTVRLLHLDGRLWASAGFTGGLPSDSWTWIAETVAREWGVSEDDVHLEESDRGDLVTVDGVPFYIRC